MSDMKELDRILSGAGKHLDSRGYDIADTYASGLVASYATEDAAQIAEARAGYRYELETAFNGASFFTPELQEKAREFINSI